MDQSPGPLEGLTIGGVVYPFTPIPRERARAFLAEWHGTSASTRERDDVVDELLAEVCGAEALADIRRRWGTVCADAIDGETLILAAGRALGMSSHAAELPK